MRKKRITQPVRDQALRYLTDLNIEVHSDTHEHAWTEILQLADKHDLTPYDAAYLDLAIRLKLALASLDEDLVSAARAEAVPVLP